LNPGGALLLGCIAGAVSTIGSSHFCSYHSAIQLTFPFPRIQQIWSHVAESHWIVRYLRNSQSPRTARYYWRPCWGRFDRHR
jgi:hypothetical protein